MTSCVADCTCAWTNSPGFSDQATLMECCDWRSLVIVHVPTLSWWALGAQCLLGGSKHVPTNVLGVVCDSEHVPMS